MNYTLANNIKSAAGYNVGGITHIWLLDISNFSAYKFANSNSSEQGIVESIVASSPFMELETVNESAFTEDYSDNVFRQKLNSFVYPLKANSLNKLLIAGNNKYLVAFRTPQGRFFAFGSDGGASISFTQQTGQMGEASGYAVSIVKNSIYPLFEIQDIRKRVMPYVYRPVFTDAVCCQLQNGNQTGYQLAGFVLKETKDGQGIDTDGKLCIESGRRQAIHLLEGTQNPDSDSYEIEGEYGYDAKNLKGISIITYNPAQCAPHFPNSIYIDNSQLVFSVEDNLAVTLTSLHEWQLTQSTNIAVCSPSSGKAGRNQVVFSKTDEQGIANFVFQNLVTHETATINIVNQENVEWVLKDGEWNENGIWLISENWE
ncbi:hypothetical protein [Viscerimonas tarda]